jgi:hypothetical protein
MSTARETWEDVLTTLERDLVALQAAIDDLDQPAVATTFQPPADLGPMPADLARRALSLAAAYDTAVKRAEEEAARIADELRRLPRGHAEQQSRRARVDYHS